MAADATGRTPPAADAQAASNMERLTAARQLMSDFGRRTGLSDRERPPRRYLWTDAFAVCNDLVLFQRTGDAAWRQQALQLVDDVHHVLGRHRGDDGRTGWISGLADDEAERHPTAGGLRIGKPLPERRPNEPLREQLEWDRDGQYFHYLTRWMHALARVCAVTGDPARRRQAIELAQVARARFTDRNGPAPRMYWKMSIDLSRPLVPSTGQLDPLDALATYLGLQAAAACDPRAVGSPVLQAEIAEAAAMCDGHRWVTTDPLGIGGLLNCACQLYELPAARTEHRSLLRSLLVDAGQSLQLWGHSHSLSLPPEARLAFRELGLSIGLRAVETLIDRQAHGRGRNSVDGELEQLLREIGRFAQVADRIEQDWLHPGYQAADSWTSHEDINAVMLATSLLAADEVFAAQAATSRSGA